MNNTQSNQKKFHHDFSIPVVFIMSFPIGKTTFIFIIFILLNQRKKYIIPIPFIRNAKTVSSTCCFFHRILVFARSGFIVNNFSNIYIQVSNENTKQFLFAFSFSWNCILMMKGINNENEIKFGII